MSGVCFKIIQDREKGGREGGKEDKGQEGSIEKQLWEIPDKCRLWMMGLWVFV